MNKLTNRQEEILTFIKKYLVKKGFPPTVREIGEALNLSSPATVFVHLKHLEEKGLIRKSESKNRALELLVDNEYAMKNEKVIDVPLLGKVTAGNPIEAINQPNEFFSLPTSLIPKGKDVFVLEVNGDSMIEKGINDGDMIIVAKTNTAVNGEMVVAMTDEHEVTLKTFYRDNGFFRLHPENALLDDIILDSVTIIGKAIGLYRAF